MTTFVYGECMLHVAPRTVQVASAASTSQALDQTVPLEEIARFPFAAMMNNTNGQAILYQREFDIKAMRKLKGSDDLVFSYIANTASDLKIVANIYMWFKE